MEIELYNLKSDPREQNNVAAQNPEVVKSIAELMNREHTSALIDRFKMEELGDVKASAK